MGEAKRIPQGGGIIEPLAFHEDAGRGQHSRTTYERPAAVTALVRRAVSSFAVPPGPFWDIRLGSNLYS